MRCPLMLSMKVSLCLASHSRAPSAAFLLEHFSPCDTLNIILSYF